MRKEVLRKLVFLMLFVLILITASYCVLAFGSAPSSGEDEDSGSEDLLPEAVESEEAVSGYWIAIALDSEGNIVRRYAPTMSVLTSPTSDSYDERLLGEDGLTINLENPEPRPGNARPTDLYNYFGYEEPFGPNNVELQYVVFSLDMLPFRGESDIIRTSHGYPVIKSGYEGEDDGSDCIVCNNMDQMSTCFGGGTPFPAPATCIRFPILSKDSCADMADWHQNFCEGVSGVGANAVDSVIDPRSISVSGLGGCQEAPYTVESPRVTGGRDWFLENPDAGMYSSDFMVVDEDNIKETVIGLCCGNDIEDVGAIAAKDIEQESREHLFRNNYICYNPSQDLTNPTQDFKWVSALDTPLLFKILPITRGDDKFDVVSNSNNWFACNTGDEGLNDIYAPVERDEEERWDAGILLNEYEIIPKPRNISSQGTTILGSGSEGDGDFSGSSGMDGSEEDEGGSAGGDRRDIINEDDFTSTDYQSSGGAVVDQCDRDGDGYDGEWSTDPLADLYDPDLNCVPVPRDQYDCDENIYDEEALAALPEHVRNRLAYLARIRHPGALDYCYPSICNIEGFDCSQIGCNPITGDCDLNCIDDDFCIAEAEEIITPGEVLANPEARWLTSRFMCHNVDSSGEFAECCGWDRAFCLNPEKGRRAGSAIHTLREFNTYDNIVDDETDPQRGKTNFVLRYGVQRAPLGSPEDQREDASYWLGLVSTSNDLDIMDWSHYETLEFYMWFTENYEVDIQIGQEKPESSPDIDGYVYPFKARIVDYVVNEPELRKWLHVVIPIDEIFQIDFDPDVIIFSSNVRNLMKLRSEVRIPEGTFSNVIGVDKIFLKPKARDLLTEEGEENFYCSGTWPPVWISDLDDTSVPEYANVGSVAGREACEEIPSYAWTGTMCCGDDTGENTFYDPLTGEKHVGADTLKEYYPDTQAGCFAGNKIPENSVLMVLKYGLYHSTFSGEINRSCFNATCTYELPVADNLLVTNEYNSVYDLAFTYGGGYQSIRRAAFSPTDTAFLKAENVPLQILYFNQQFFGCNAVDYLRDFSNTVSEVPEPLIFPENLLESSGDVCEVRGAFFCDHRDGENKGWSNEPLLVYPNVNEDGEVIRVITSEEGEEIELSTNLVPASLRSFAKRNYNLISNGGFEND